MALSLTQRRALSQMILQYVADQSRASNDLALADFAAASAAAQKATLLPYAQTALSGASTSLAALPTTQAAQTAAMTTAVADYQALVTLLGG